MQEQMNATPIAYRRGAVEQRKADGAEAAVATQTRLVDTDEAPSSRPRHVQSGDRQRAS